MSRAGRRRKTASTSSRSTTASRSKDLVSYNDKHNEANGEGNRDGIDENLGWNCGGEGPTADPAIAALRTRQMKNGWPFSCCRGVPMLLGGDEIRRTQGGNNNAYNQDNPTSWFDWTSRHEAGDPAVCSADDRVPQGPSALSRPRFYTGGITGRRVPDIAWHGTGSAPGLRQSGGPGARVHDRRGGGPPTCT